MNPKLYFKIEKGILIPLAGQNKSLDRLFESNYCELASTLKCGTFGAPRPNLALITNIRY